ncbi:helix-turn-helix transcriptional regulator [Streptomyces sp. NPDC047315]|uniref:helix-turn-helix domain-containing protein n=1 Tax=Streptomyces sp. NPDC047315 TaxID=3155142 RepID=UPI0033C28392
MQEALTTFEVKGTAICDTRKQAGLDVRTLAEQIGCTPSYLRKLERGDRNRMSPRLYVRLRAALAATDEDLLADSEEPT